MDPWDLFKEVTFGSKDREHRKDPQREEHTRQRTQTWQIQDRNTNKKVEAM